MEQLIIVVLLVIAAETTYLTYTAGRKQQRAMQSPVFVDTSVLIDGRIVAIAESGFITRPLYIPRSVVGELQFLADNADTEKRTRARHGLDVINQLQSIPSVETIIFADGVRAEEGVDNRLLTLAKKHNGALCTIDYNLNKVAVVEGLQVLNVNELAKTLRMAYLPGEKLTIELTQKGNDQHQGVGHLPDGTMVVVEHASKYVGTFVEVEFIRSLQTAAGRMMFAKLVQVAAKSQVANVAAPVRAKAAAKVQKPIGRQAVKQDTHEKPAEQQDAQRSRPAKKQPQPARHPEQAPTENNQKPRSNNRNNFKRRKSPEDSLVELANGS